MNFRTARRGFETAMLLCLALFTDTPLLAQSTIKVSTPGTAFAVVGRSGQAENGAGGITVRAKGFELVKLRGVLRMPPSGSNVTHTEQMQRMVVRFRASAGGPSLRSVDLYNGQQKALHLPTDLRGDYTTTEKSAPESVANTWAWNPPVKVSSQTMVVLEVQFPGGFEGSADTGSFVLASVEASFARELVIKRETGIQSGDALSSLGVGSKLPALLPGNANAVIYAVANNNDLLWYRHDGRDDGSFRWGADAGRRVGSGWSGKHIFPAGDGVIYIINASNELLWYRHTGRADGTVKWAADTGRKVGVGWGFRKVFSGGGGVIYAITNDGDLLWYRHDGRDDGSVRWADNQGRKIGIGWNFPQVFAGDDGVIYAITDSGDLLWYRHDGRADGSNTWAAPEGRNVGVGWTFKHVFSGGNGVIYAVNAGNDLLWYRHVGRNDGSVTWADNQGRKVGQGWDVRDVFSGAVLAP